MAWRQARGSQTYSGLELAWQCVHMFLQPKKTKHFMVLKNWKYWKKYLTRNVFRAVFFPHSFSTTFTNHPRLYICIPSLLQNIKKEQGNRTGRETDVHGNASSK